MRKTIAIVTLGLAVGVWGCDRGGGETEAQAQGSEHGHAHEGEEGHAHEGEEEHHEEEGHAHEGEEGHAHEAEERHHEGEEGHHHDGEDGHHHEEANYAKEGTVEVPKGGKEFDPPVPVDRLPEGAWYCDMGKAPWAAMEKPKDGCPVEGAPLKQISK